MTLDLNNTEKKVRMEFFAFDFVHEQVALAREYLANIINK